MRKFTVAQGKEIDALQTRLAEVRTALAEAIDTYNGAVGDAYRELCEARDAYNEAAEEIEEAVHEMAAPIREEVEADHTDKWHETNDSGFESWASAWEDYSIEQFTPDEPDELQPPETEDIDQLQREVE